MMKILVVLIMGFARACRCDELIQMSLDGIEDKITILIVKIPDTKTNKLRRFVVVGTGDIQHNMILYRRSLDLLNSYLSGTFQRLAKKSVIATDTVITEALLNLVLIKQGVPQESIVGPLQFLILVNNLYKCINITSLHQYSDATSCIMLQNSIDSLAQKTSKMVKTMAD